jgi:hypothetical protein
MGANYFHQGILKAFLGDHILQWPLTYRLELSLGWSWFQGWDWYLSQGSKEIFFNFLKILDRPLILSVYGMELGAILILLSSMTSLSIILFFIGFHLAVFAVSGVFFWIWIVVNVIIIILHSNLKEEDQRKLYRSDLLIISMILIFLLSTSGFFTRQLAWWETRYNYRVELEGITPKGRSHKLSKLAISPYHFSMPFVYNKQSYLIPHRYIPSGTKNYSVFKEINQQIKRSKKQAIGNLIKHYGKNNYDEGGTKKFKVFVQKYFKNYYSSSPKFEFLNELLDFIQPPKFYYTNLSPSLKRISDFKGRIQEIKVNFVDGIFLNARNHRIDKKTIMRISIPNNQDLKTD